MSIVEPLPDPQVSSRNKLNHLTAKEWLSESVSVWTQRGLGAGHVDAEIERQHPAPFSFTDVARLIRMLTKPGMTVLDPFMGVGSTLKAAASEGRNGIGIELYPHFVELTERRLATERVEGGQTTQIVVCDDARSGLAKIEEGSVDLVVTSPPYWSILNKKADHKVLTERVDAGLRTSYGHDTRDLGNIASYTEFIEELGELLRASARALAVGRYMAVIVGDFRHGAKYYMFHADVARVLESESIVLQAVNVLYQRHKRVFPYGYPYAYVPNVHHQNILIFRKLA